MGSSKEIKVKKNLWKKTSKGTKGITLIALVITIIVLLILAGVSVISLTGDNGILNRARQATESHEIASEKEYLEQMMLSMQINNYSGNANTEKIGEALHKKSLNHSYDWHVIKVGETRYDEGWYFIKKETPLEGYGNAKHSMLVNYETGEIIQLEEGSYQSLEAGDMLAVKEDLIINVDSSIIDQDTPNDKESIQKQLGDGVTLENFNLEDENSGLTSTAFNFDGVDDYIKVEYDRTEQKELLAKNGFTFEFYGIWDGGTSYNADREIIDRSYNGFFCYWNGSENDQADVRFGILDERYMTWNAGWTGLYSDFCKPSFPQNILYDVKEKFEKKIPVYITITLDTSESYEVQNETYKGYDGKETSSINEKKNGTYYKQKVYIDGKLLYDGDYNKEYWESFINKYLPSLHYFCIGRSSMDDDGHWHYSKMNAYALRLYSRALSDDEVRLNYEKSVSYHSELVE